MARIFSEDTRWAIAGRIDEDALERIAGQLPKELQETGSKIVVGKDGFAALLVFGDLPNERLAKQLLTSVTPVYLLDFDDEAPAIVKLDRKKTRVTATRENEHPADFLDERGIVVPGYNPAPSPVMSVGLVEGATVAEANRACPDAEFEFRAHPRGVLVVGDEVGMGTGLLSGALRRRAYIVYRDRRDGSFSCNLYEPGQATASFSPVRPKPNRPVLDNILGETTLDGILRVLSIPGELLGVDAADR